MIKPVAVLISDIHYNLQTLPVADAALRMAVDKANELSVPLVIAGDLHDTKANLRAECVNAMLETIRPIRTECFILRGNHDQINEKSETHALNFIGRDQVIVTDYYPSETVETSGITVIVKPTFTNEIAVNGMSVHLVPYQHDPSALVRYLATIDKGSTVITHQGCSDSNSGEYIQDKSALPKETFKNFRVVSGHYHTRQTIDCAEEFTANHPEYHGVFDYIGNPFTLNFAEANDPPKGFQILNNDGSLTFVPTNLRKHVTYDIRIYNEEGAATWDSVVEHAPGDIIRVRAYGPSDWLLAKINKKIVGDLLSIKDDFRLEFCPSAPVSVSVLHGNKPSFVILDELIDTMENMDDTRKERIKNLWKSLAGDN